MDRNQIPATLHCFMRSFMRTAGRPFSTLSILAGLILSACSQEQPAPTSTPLSAPTSSSSAPSPASQASGSSEKSFGPIKAKVPAEWIEQTPSSAMRKAQYALPKAEGDSEDGELTVFYFGLGQGGSVEANIDRWIGQISQPDNSSSKDKAKIVKKEVLGLPVTQVDVSGTYSAGMMSPGPPRPGYRLMGAVVETPEGPWFFKLVGPQKTIAKWAPSFDFFVGSFRKA
jgi:hypothetical protein